MQLNWKSAAVLLIAFAGIAAGLYTLGMEQGSKSEAETPAVSGEQAAGPVGAQAEVPSDHPPLDSLRKPAQPERQGRAQADPNAKVTHFRVGERNVKYLFVNGKVVWVATSSGLIRYDTGDDGFRLFDTRDGLSSAAVLEVAEVKGRIAAATAGGLALYDKASGQWHTVAIPGVSGDIYVDAVMAAANGDVWIATHSGVYRVKGGDFSAPAAWRAYTVANTRGGLPDDRVYGLAQGKDGAIWFATQNGVARFNGGWRHWNHRQGLGASLDKIGGGSRFAEAGADVPAHRGGSNGKGFNIAYNPDYVTSILVDREGTVWCGTWGGGLARFDGKGWHNYTTADGLPGNHVFTLALDHGGHLWIGTDKGLARWTGKGFTVLTTADGLYSDYVFAVAAAPNGSLWVGTFGGVARLRGVL